MEIHPGDQLEVNLAPFIGSPIRSRHTVSCRAVAVREGLIQVIAEPPCREVEMWVEPRWVEPEPVHPRRERVLAK